MGLFIAIEGGDGSGKATQTKLLADFFRSRGINLLQLSFPRYGEASAYYVEQYLNGVYGSSDEVPAELASLTYAIDRSAAKNEIINHLKQPDNVVLSDRSIASNFAHQGAKISDASKRKAFYERTMVTEYEVLGFPRPDLNIVLLVPPLISQENVDKKNARTYTALKRDIHESDSSHLEKAKANFEELCMLYPNEFTSIDCMNGDGVMRTIESIQAEIQERIHDVVATMQANNQ
jgi:dTMP kinase